MPVWLVVKKKEARVDGADHNNNNNNNNNMACFSLPPLSLDETKEQNKRGGAEDGGFFWGEMKHGWRLWLLALRCGCWLAVVAERSIGCFSTTELLLHSSPVCVWIKVRKDVLCFRSEGNKETTGLLLACCFAVAELL